ncbi:MAG TPA: hypothetical protein VJ576_10715 [Rhodocyclaceae bacterium]|nr:hypothetical protein [Rhodocyclaceae bacterium]
MYQFELPAPGPAAVPPFRSADEAAAWLARQPLAQPAQMQAVLQQAIGAVDASDIPPAARRGVLDRLRSAVVLAQTALEPRFSRKPLPLPTADAEHFLAARRLWRLLAVAYLRIAPELPAADAALALHRAAVALRAEQYAHFLAAYEVPAELLLLLHGIASAAEALGVQYTPLGDPDYKHISESHIAGHVAWTFMLQFADPYRLSMAQLTVANRALSRWRELAAFRMQPDDSPRARDLPLMDLLGRAGLAKGGPRWLDVRPVVRKLRHRIEALEGGQRPEELKLGRELSATACARLLGQLDEALQPGPAAAGGESGNLSLVFGAENIYALLAGERLNPAAEDTRPRTVDHQRLAVFGFDNRVTPVAAAKPAQVSGETWQAGDGFVWRAPEAGVRLLSPCLVAAAPGAGQTPRLGVLLGLRVGRDGRLRARLQWYGGPVQAASVQVGGAGGPARVPVFVVGDDGALSLVLPAAAPVRPDGRLALEGSGRAPVGLGQVLERGSDFVRYAAAPR